MLSLGSQQLG